MFFICLFVYFLISILNYFYLLIIIVIQIKTNKSKINKFLYKLNSFIFMKKYCGMLFGLFIMMIVDKKHVNLN